MIRFASRVLWLVAAAAVLSACVMGLPEKGEVTAGPDESLVLGVIAPLTGPLAVEGEGIANAARLAVERAGPVAGRPVRVEVLDDGCEPARTEQAVRKLMLDQRLLAVVGPACSRSCIVAGNLLHERASVMVSPRCTDIAVTRQGAAGVFRTVWTDAFEAAAAARYAWFNLSAERAFVVHDGTVYAKNLRDVFKTFYGEDNIEGISELRIGADSGPVIRTIARSTTRSIHYFGFADGAAPFLRDLRAAGITVPVMLPEAVLEGGLLERAGEAADGARITRVLAPPLPPLSFFPAAYRSRYGSDPPPFAAEAYDAARAILEAAKDEAETRAGTARIDRRGLLDAMYQTDFNGVTGRVRFRLNGDRMQGARVQVLRVQGGAIEPERTLILPE